MFVKLSEEEFLELAKTHKRIAVYQEISSDQLTPISAYLLLANGKKGTSLLESLYNVKDLGLYSFIGADPVLTFESKGSKITLIKDGHREVQEGDPRETLKSLLSRYATETIRLPSTFMGGAIGFCTYDAVRLVENISDRHEDVEQIPDLFFHFYDTTLVFDHQKAKIRISHIVEVDGDPKACFLKARKKVDAITLKLQEPLSLSRPKQQERESESAIVDISDEEYKGLVEKAKQYTRQGDVFQVVLSRSFQKSFSGEPIDVYRALRRLNPSPYMFFLDNEDFTIAGASPEQIVSVQGDTIQSTPIAGTRKRGKNMEEDASLEKELQDDEKELAEHMMLVDLARNDVGATALPGTVEVKEFKEIQKFSHVMHLVSRVEGKRDPNIHALDVFFKNFPAGTLTGAPKIRAMEIIDELETSKRGLYGGAVLSVDYQGNLYSCIIIRSALFREGQVTVRAGGGIVYDSNPEDEANETRNKAAAVLEAVRMAEGGNI